MTAIGTSVAVAAFATWHESHALAARTLSKKPRLIAHVALETYAVLTRLPPPHRAPANLVLDFLDANFPGGALTLPGDEQRRLVRDAVARGIAGGAIYDALIGATARHAREQLLTLDRRAIATYEMIGADARLLR